MHSSPIRSRRVFLKAVAAMLTSVSIARADTPLTFGTTPVILDEQTEFLHAWRRYLEQQLQREIRVVQRSRYREIQILLATDKLDCAWLCGYPYVQHKSMLDLIAVPVYSGAPLYRSYLIVPADDRVTQSIIDLRDKVFAFSDPESNSGWLAHLVELKRHGLDANSFFKKHFFTWSHRKVIDAVAHGLAQGGAVDGYIWDTLAVQHPHLTSATRIAWRSRPFGFPPIVARRGLAEETRSALRAALLGMSEAPKGQELLRRLNLDRFVAGDPALFDDIEANWRYLST